ncbi:hypothetical protein ABIB50_000651 [Mucilaginibacter sp. UYCu711]
MQRPINTLVKSLDKSIAQDTHKTLGGIGFHIMHIPCNRHKYTDWSYLQRPDIMIFREKMQIFTFCFKLYN